jgi:hypothetical protein
MVHVGFEIFPELFGNLLVIRLILCAEATVDGDFSAVLCEFQHKVGGIFRLSKVQYLLNAYM